MNKFQSYDSLCSFAIIRKVPNALSYASHLTNLFRIDNSGLISVHLINRHESWFNFVSSLAFFLLNNAGIEHFPVPILFLHQRGHIKRERMLPSAFSILWSLHWLWAFHSLPPRKTAQAGEIHIFPLSLKIII